MDTDNDTTVTSDSGASQDTSNVADATQVSQDSGRQWSGDDPVDLSHLPDEVRKPVEDRINYLYKQFRTNEKTARELRDIAEQQSQRIDELTNGMGRVVDHIENQTTAQTESQLTNQLQLAYENGDYASVAKIQRELFTIQAQKLVGKKQEKEPAQKPVQPQVQHEGAGLNIGEHEEIILDSWQDERDPSGNNLRPWAFPNHPLFQAAYKETINVLTSPAYQNKSFEQKLMEVDRRMGLNPSKPAQNVMGGNLTTRKNTSNIKLTPKQQEIAVRTKFGSNKGAKSDAEYIEAYKKQLQTTKGAR